MRYRQYITEGESTFEELIGIIESKCQPMAKVYKKTVKMYQWPSDMFMWRSTNLGNWSFRIRGRRKDRRPLNMDVGITKALDKAFKKVHGWKPRTQGVFATSYDNAKGYGSNNCIFFPIGKLDYLHAPGISDLFIDITQYDIYDHTASEEDVLKLVKDYTDKDLIKGLKDEDEFMWNCNEYLAVDETYMEMLIGYFEGRYMS